ncbi:exodeoxyribonuclease III [Basilea psittacipulmonis]|uniref:Exodeoxyribonuclease III n=1 Tax=Basilea psittacipulmonis DSM 24701 TaxID=1072685 RepID=A0A077DD08_9BURK|nr:exodeoxyribonuclease III [Basilea psittacipulmonis]AIL32061.1 exodeoxyribonuclease III [Basilea psittacipulmonis DSM 24701]
MLRITSVNVNGIRSAVKKDFFDWLAEHQADVVCLQEIKISDPDLTESLRHPLDYQGAFCHAEKKGYSGVGLYTKQAPDTLSIGMGSKEFDPEGRLIKATWPNLTIISAYLPSGSSSEERQAAKFRFLAEFDPWIDAMMEDYQKTGHNYLICGDWNIAHKEIDIKNWKGNLKNSGFTPEERAWIDDLLTRRGFVDIFRQLNPNPDEYTWWSNRGQAWAKNVGWRIDYQIGTPGIAKAARQTSIYRDKRFSDHAPLTIDYDWSLT